MEGLIREDYMDAYLAFYKDNKIVQKNILKSFIGRSTDMTYVKNNILNSSMDLMIFNKTVVFMSWKDEIAIKIKNENIIQFMKEIFYLIKEDGKKIDQNEYYRKLLSIISENE